MKRTAAAPRRAFTLIELLVVIAIIISLMAFLVPVISGVIDASRRKAAEATMSIVSMSLGYYQNTFGDFPPDNVPTADGSEALIYHLCRVHQVGERTEGPFLDANKVSVRDTDGNGNLELISPMGGKVHYFVLTNAAGRPWGYLLIDPGKDRKLGGTVDPANGFVPDGTGADKDNLTHKERGP
jgi:prepilin-type N-terminal cleavage/methylation domain-containing protein